MLGVDQARDEPVEFMVVQRATLILVEALRKFIEFRVRHGELSNVH